jgi:hypothetical protein
MSTEQVAPLRLTARADPTVPTLTMAHIDPIAPHELARTSEALATLAPGGSRCEPRKHL